ncbi:MAG: hypothetical protein HKN10_01755 [Myxococcales bacterium]|nr:hypothetical protein [Myxococcales bacterium]
MRRKSSRLNARTVALIVTTVGAAALTAYTVHDLREFKESRQARSLEVGQRAGIRVAEALDETLSEVSERATEYSKVVARIDSEPELLESIKKESFRFPLVMGVTVAFEPGAFAGKERYSPFFNKARDEFQFIEQAYDYTSRELETAKWYTAVVESGKARWSEPYFAKAAETMVVDYGVPVVDDEGRTIGIVDYAISLSDFTRIVDALSVGEAGYGFTYDETGAILSHPNPIYLLQNVFQLRDGKNEAIVNSLREDAEGVVAYNSTYTYKHSWFFFRELKSTGWKSVLVFAEDDLLGASDEGRRKIIQIGIGIGLLLIALLALLALVQGVDGFNRKELWRLATLTSLVLLGNIVLIWYLNVTTDFSRFDHDVERIVNDTILDNYVEQSDAELYKLVNARYSKVPTGIFIESYELSSFEASIIGKLWMKYPKDLYETAPPGFYLPDVSALETRGLVQTKLADVEYDDYVLVTWRFRVTLEEDFSYRQYPFEQNDVALRILYPDFSKNVLLVPDLQSYDILNPSVRPGLNPDVSVPSSETIASFFTLSNAEFKTTFGNRRLVKSYPMLTFHMVFKRNYLNPFVANIIPILIVVMMMFVVLYISSRKQDGRAGLTTMNVIQSSAGFLFILILAHVNERARIETPEIAYIELFYFSMYLYITVQTLALAAMFRGVDWKLFEWEDNLILKLSFWPLLLAIWFAFTLARFY